MLKMKKEKEKKQTNETIASEQETINTWEY